MKTAINVPTKKTYPETMEFLLLDVLRFPSYEVGFWVDLFRGMRDKGSVDVPRILEIGRRNGVLREKGRPQLKTQTQSRLSRLVTYGILERKGRQDYRTYTLTTRFSKRLEDIAVIPRRFKKGLIN